VLNVRLPERGRRFADIRQVRLGDVDPAARLRLDALARYLQDVATDDAMDADLQGATAWVLRRLVLELGRPVLLGERLSLVTFCAGTGGRWAERATAVSAGEEQVAAASALWICLDPDTGRPARLSPRFHDLYGEAAAGRRVGSHLHHPPPPAEARRRSWPLRAADLDILGHVNNAVALAAVEELRPGAAYQRVEVEYRQPLAAGDETELVTAEGAVWLEVGGQVRVSALVH